MKPNNVRKSFQRPREVVVQRGATRPTSPSPATSANAMPVPPAPTPPPPGPSARADGRLELKILLKPAVYRRVKEALAAGANLPSLIEGAIARREARLQAKALGPMPPKAKEAKWRLGHYGRMLELFVNRPEALKQLLEEKVAEARWQLGEPEAAPPAPLADSSPTSTSTEKEALP